MNPFSLIKDSHDANMRPNVLAACLRSSELFSRLILVLETVHFTPSEVIGEDCCGRLWDQTSRPTNFFQHLTFISRTFHHRKRQNCFTINLLYVLNIGPLMGFPPLRPKTNENLVNLWGKPNIRTPGYFQRSQWKRSSSLWFKTGEKHNQYFTAITLLQTQTV